MLALMTDLKHGGLNMRWVEGYAGGAHKLRP